MGCVEDGGLEGGGSREEGGSLGDVGGLGGAWAGDPGGSASYSRNLRELLRRDAGPEVSASCFEERIVPRVAAWLGWLVI